MKTTSLILGILASVGMIAALIAGLTSILQSCQKQTDPIKNKTRAGEIYRTSDNKKLSEVKLKISNDAMFVFSNAIFGADNDTLLLTHFDAKDTLCTYKNKSNDLLRFYCQYKKSEKGETLAIGGDDFYILSKASAQDIFSPGSLSFYRNRSVPRNPVMYLDGAYEGEAENQLLNMWFSAMGGIKFKLVFLDDFKVRFYVKSIAMDLFGGRNRPAYEEADYRVEGNRLIMGKNKSKAKGIEVKNNGKTLVLSTDKISIVMHKIY